MDTIDTDVLVVGAGHNGLVAALMLARAGLRVQVVEARDVVGGAARTEAPFPKVPGLRTSTGAYLLGLFPPELLQTLGLELPVLRRDPHYFLPTPDERYLLLGSDEDEVKRQFTEFFSDADWKANQALNAELDALRNDVGRTWLMEPRSIEETAERYVRPELRDVFVDLCRKPISEYLSRFGFESELLMAMYAVTDAFSGLHGGWDTPGTGMNFLIHNMCRLPAADGTWMIVRGGMGTVTQRLADLAVRAGATIATGAAVRRIEVQEQSVTGAELSDGRRVKAKVVVCNCDPFQMQQLVGVDSFPSEYNDRLDGYRRHGTTLKVNLALADLPRFTCLPEARGQHHTTIHLLPQENVIESLRSAFEAATHGRLPEFPAIEWYIHTSVDPSLQDEAGHHNSALFVQWVPYELEQSSWEREEPRYVEHLLSICDRFAPGTSSLVLDRFSLHPQKIEEHFGMSFGHIHHVDNTFGFADRLPYATPIAGLYSASAGCHPAGSVIGAAGHNCARRVARDLETEL